MDRTFEFRSLIVELAPRIDPLTIDDPKTKLGRGRLILSAKSKQLQAEQLRDFAVGAKGLVITISKMKQFLLENRRDYINLYSPLMSMSSKMGDSERDQIDYDVQVFMKNCNDLIKNYKGEINSKGKHMKPQAKEHQNLVILLIEFYMKQVCDIYTRQKAIRVKRACEKQKMSRLADTLNGRRKQNGHVTVPPRPRQTGRSNGQANHVALREDSGLSEVDATPLRISSNTNQAALFAAESDALASLEHQMTISPEELQMFDKENDQLYDDMNALNDEVKQIGGKVVEIARLQELFTENVLQQEQELSRLNDTVISSTENIRGGNDQLREAIRQGAGLRVWVLFFIITLAFTVLFLDWYNP